ncbi:unnamed protein product [Euphydryas editha]|uniref:Retrovirus-related Pol polyprotein from transposon TNT 1-94-like beta-barrel domain-containing protein n=1 Tax=Euphydryas editha TaxID=104508 RepID=A0AAU9UH44_EUPED|nr:unnamed protein product [Euphydryas editha]
MKRMKKNPTSDGTETTNLASVLIAHLPSQIFILDSGASSHMVNDKRFLYNFAPCNQSITTANNEVINCEGQGQIDLRFKRQINNPLLLSNVMSVPQLSCNLISISKLFKSVWPLLNNFEVIFYRKGCQIYDNKSKTTGVDNQIAYAVCCNGLFKLNACINVNTNKFSPMDLSLFLEGSQESLRATIAAGLSTELWHRRQGP